MSVNNFKFTQSGNDAAQVLTRTISEANALVAITTSLPLPTITAIAGGTKVIWVASFTGTITGVRAAVDAAFTATDIVITTKINGTAVTTGAVTIPTAGSAALTAASATPTAANTFIAGDVVNCTITGGVGTAGGVVSLSLTRTA